MNVRCTLLSILLCVAASASFAEPTGPPADVGVIDEGSHLSFRPELVPPLPVTYAKYFESDSVADDWVLLENDQPVELSVGNMQMTSFFAFDSEGNEDESKIGSFQIRVKSDLISTDKTYHLQPSVGLAAKLASLDPTAEQVLKKRLLWRAAKDELLKPKKGFHRLLSNELLRVDVMPTAADSVDVDYSLKWETSLNESLQDSTWLGFVAGFESAGYLRVPDSDDEEDGDDNALNSIISQVNLQSRWVWFKDEADSADLLSIDGQNTARREGTFDPFAFNADVHLKHETDQSFDDQQIAIGVGASMNIPFPRFGEDAIPLPLLPLWPILAIDRGDLAQVQQPWFAAMLDYVDAGQNDSRDMLTDDSEYLRLQTEIGWTTEVFAPNTWLYTKFHFWWELDAPDAIEQSDQDAQHFVEVGLKIPVSQDNKNTWLIVKFQDGAIPPNFDEGTQVNAGLSFSF